MNDNTKGFVSLIIIFMVFFVTLLICDYLIYANDKINCRRTYSEPYATYCVNAVEEDRFFNQFLLKIVEKEE